MIRGAVVRLEDEDDMMVRGGERRTIEPTLALNLAYKDPPEPYTASPISFSL